MKRFIFCQDENGAYKIYYYGDMDASYGSNEEGSYRGYNTLTERAVQP